VPEEEDVHPDHDGYQRENVQHDRRLPSHRFVLLRATQRSKSSAQPLRSGPVRSGPVRSGPLTLCRIRATCPPVAGGSAPFPARFYLAHAHSTAATSAEDSHERAIVESDEAGPIAPLAP
jgi:hypothetical protein